MSSKSVHEQPSGLIKEMEEYVIARAVQLKLISTQRPVNSGLILPRGDVICPDNPQALSDLLRVPERAIKDRTERALLARLWKDIESPSSRLVLAAGTIEVALKAKGDAHIRLSKIPTIKQKQLLTSALATNHDGALKISFLYYPTLSIYPKDLLSAFSRSREDPAQKFEEISYSSMHDPANTKKIFDKISEMSAEAVRHLRLEREQIIRRILDQNQLIRVIERSIETF